MFQRFVSRSHRGTGPVRLQIYAPPPVDFIEYCVRLGISIPAELLRPRVRIEPMAKVSESAESRFFDSEEPDCRGAEILTDGSLEAIKVPQLDGLFFQETSPANVPT